MFGTFLILINLHFQMIYTSCPTQSVDHFITITQTCIIAIRAEVVDDYEQPDVFIKFWGRKKDTTNLVSRQTNVFQPDTYIPVFNHGDSSYQVCYSGPVDHWAVELWDQDGTFLDGADDQMSLGTIPSTKIVPNECKAEWLSKQTTFGRVAYDKFYYRISITGTTRNPTSSPITSRPTRLPTLVPTTSHPTRNPTKNPTPHPSVSPSTRFPTTNAPTSTPTNGPSGVPSYSPTTIPSLTPSAVPTQSPVAPTIAPTNAPSNVPSLSPTHVPSQLPSSPPSTSPSKSPSSSPSNFPSNLPSNFPSYPPSLSPSTLPTIQPTQSPSRVPSWSPTGMPSLPPTTPPSALPTPIPTQRPSVAPTAVPTISPTVSPTQRRVIPRVNTSLDDHANFGSNNTFSSGDVGTRSVSFELFLVVIICAAVMGGLLCYLLCWLYAQQRRKIENEVKEANQPSSQPSGDPKPGEDEMDQEGKDATGNDGIITGLITVGEHHGELSISLPKTKTRSVDSSRYTLTDPLATDRVLLA